MKSSAEWYFFATLIWMALQHTSVAGLLRINSTTDQPDERDYVKITCNIDSFAGSATWTKVSGSTSLPLTTCVLTANACFPPNSTRYKYGITTSSIFVEIASFNSSLDVFTWRCEFNFSDVSYNLTAFIPTTTTTSSSSSTTTTTTTTVTSSPLYSTSSSSSTSNVTISKTSTNPTTTGSAASAISNTFTSISPTTVLPANDTNNTSTSRSPTTAGSTVSATSNNSTSTSPTVVSPANNASNTSTSINPTTAGPNATTKTTASNNQSKSINSVDIKVIVPAVVVPCGLLIIGAIILLVVLCVRRRAGKNVRESPDGIDVQDKCNNVDGWKQSLGHGKATDNLDAVYTTPHGFIIYPGPAAISTARSYKDKKYLDVTDQYSRPYPGTYHHQAAYIPSTYTSARSYTHKGKKHHGVTDPYSKPYTGTYGYQTAYVPSTDTHKDKKHHDVVHPYSRPYTGTYGYQAAYVPSTYMSARANSHKGKNYDFEGCQQASHQMATSRPAYDWTTYYPQTGHNRQSGDDVYYSGGGQYSYGQRSRSHHDHNGSHQQREYNNQYEMADYGGNRAGYIHTQQDMAFYY